MLHFDWISGFIYPYLNFSFFLVLLIYFIKKPVKMFAKKKKEDFEKLYLAAKKSKEESELRLKEQVKRFDSLEQEVAELKKQTTTAAEKEAQQIVQKAKDFSEYLKQEAGKISNIELAKAEEVIKKEVWSCAKQVVIEKIKVELSGTEKQKELFDSSLNKISEIGQ